MSPCPAADTSLFPRCGNVQEEESGREIGKERRRKKRYEI